MAIYKFKNGTKIEHILILRAFMAKQDSKNYLETFAVEDDPDAEKIKKTKDQNLEQKQVRDLIKVIQKENFSKSQTEINIIKLKLTHEKGILSRLSKSNDRSDFLIFLSKKYQTITTDSKEESHSFAWEDRVAPARSDIFIRQIMKDFFVSFNSYEIAEKWLEDENSIEIYYQAFRKGDAIIRTKVDVVRDVANYLLKGKNFCEPKLKTDNEVKSHFQIHRKRIARAYDSLKKSFENEDIFYSNSFETELKNWI